MKGSSSHTGLKEFPWEVFVLNFLFVSTGKPNISTSTYIPTRLSDRNCPEIIWQKDNSKEIRYNAVRDLMVKQEEHPCHPFSGHLPLFSLY